MKKMRSVFSLALLTGLLSAAALFRFGLAPEAPAESALANSLAPPRAAPAQEHVRPMPYADAREGSALTESCPACRGDSSRSPALAGLQASAASAQSTLPARLPKVQPTPEEETVIREKLAPFVGWAQRLDTPEATVLEATTLETGKKLALQRRDALKELIRSDPRLALQQALPYALRQHLPPAVQDLVEQPVTGKGNLVAVMGVRDGGAAPPIRHIAEIGSKTYQAYVYGRRAEQTTKRNVSVHGVAVDGELAVSESPVRVLDLGEPPSAGKTQAEQRCLVSGKEVNLVAGTGASSAAAIAESGDRVYYLCSGPHLEALGTQVAAQEAAADSGPLPLVSGDRKTAIILVNYLDSSVSYTLADANNVLNALSADYKEMSFNQLWFSGNAYGPFVINQNISSGSMDTTPFNQAATAAGVNLSAYQHVVYILPGNSPIFSGGIYGYGSMPGSVTWINGWYGVNGPVIAHELGHNLGMHHASRPGSEYADSSDIMGIGGGLCHVNGPHKVQMGWAPWTSVTASGSYTVSLLEQSGFGSQVLVLAKPDTKENYFVSFRVPEGFDSGLRTDYANKVNIHRWKGGGSIQTFFLQALDDGQTFTDSANGIAIGLVSHDATRATVNVTVSSAPAAPVLFSQPSSQTVTAGQTVTFSVGAMGTAPLSYQWQKYGNGIENIPGATGSSYTTPATTLADNGTLYQVVVSNVVGSVTSGIVMLTVNPSSNQAPSITTQPANQTVTAGQTATFSVVATGMAPLSYQWRKNGANLAGATGSSYPTPATTTADSGLTFSVVVSNSAGSATSANAILTVNPPVNQAPVISSAPWANPNPVTLPNTTTINVIASDPDNGPAALTYTWSKVSGTGTTTFSPNGMTASASSTASFSAAGSYTLRVTVSDGAANVSGDVAVTVNGSGNAVTVDANTLYQTMEGFGGTARVFDDPHVWNNFDPATGKSLTTMTLAQQDEVLDRLYMDLKLTRTRYHTDGGVEPVNDNNDPEVTDLTKFNFAWKRCDAMVDLAKRSMARGLLTPYFIGTYETWGSEATTSPAEYVEWSMAVLNRWRQLGVELPYWDVFNEPGLAVAEGNKMVSGAYMRDAMKIMGPKMRAAGFATKFVIPDDVNPQNALGRAQIILADATARSYVGAVATHLYGADYSALGQLKTLAESYGLPLWMTEYSSGTDGFTWAGVMHNMIANFNVSAVDSMMVFFGEWAEVGPFPGSQLVIMKNNGAQYLGYELTRNYYAVGQYARYVQPGARRIKAVSTDAAVQVTAFVKGADLSIVAINNMDTWNAPRTLSFNLVGLPGMTAAQPIRTSNTENWASLAPIPVSGSAFSATLPPKSITTFVLSGSSNQPPSIITQPASQTVTVGQTATFSVVATGTAPLSYQWRKNSANIAGATSASYTTPATVQADSGSTFSVVVSNSAGSVASNNATLTVNATAVAPSIATQPASQTVTAGQTATFSVAVTGTAPLSYQWRKGGVNIGGANAVSYTTPATTTSDGGAVFSVVVSNTAGSVTSNGATLTVTTASNLVAYWKLDDGAGATAADSSGNSHTGTLVNGPLWTAGRSNGALSLNGLNGYVAVADFDPPANLTLEAWIFPGNNTGADSLILNKHNSEYDFRVGENGNLGGTAGGVALSDASFNFYAVANRDQWYHVAYTFDSAADIHRLYRNGLQVASGANTGAISNQSTQLWIGRHSQFNFGTFLGKLDEVRIYNQALSAQEILNRYNSFFAANKKDFNKDGKADILFRHPSSGEVSLWLMQ